MSSYFYSNGKLLLTAEYGVLDGALALGIPTTFGQSLTIEETDERTFEWISLNDKDQAWFEASFDSNTFEVKNTSDHSVSSRLIQILKKIKALNADFIATDKGYRLIAKLTFPRNWGLGSSSTLINNLAQWAKVDPYELLEGTFGGSGYDIACAQNHTPIHYQITDGQPLVKSVDFNPIFKEQLFFIFLNKKQDSRKAISNYRTRNFNTKKLVAQLNELTQTITYANSLATFEKLISQHEALLSNVLGIAPVKERLFSDFEGAIKSLGGWGGDFVLATGHKKTLDYFKAKGFDIVIPYEDMVL